MVLPWYFNDTPPLLPWYFNDTPPLLTWYSTDTPTFFWSIGSIAFSPLKLPRYLIVLGFRFLQVIGILPSRK